MATHHTDEFGARWSRKRGTRFHDKELDNPLKNEPDSDCTTSEDDANQFPQPQLFSEDCDQHKRDPGDQQQEHPLKYGLTGFGIIFLYLWQVHVLSQLLE